MYRFLFVYISEWDDLPSVRGGDRGGVADRLVERERLLQGAVAVITAALAADTKTAVHASAAAVTAAAETAVTALRRQPVAGWLRRPGGKAAL